MVFNRTDRQPRSRPSRTPKLHGFMLTTVLTVFTNSAPAALAIGQTTLSQAKAIKCDFPLHAAGTWVDGIAMAEVKRSSLSLRFESIDRVNGAATAMGLFGSTDVIVRPAPGRLHLMQIDSAGALSVTTVFDKATVGGRVTAVHTRHEFTEVSLPGFTSRPEQHYGDCSLE